MPKVQILLGSAARDERGEVASALRAAGWQLTTARDGHAALQLVRARVPDLAVLDVQLPGLDGLEVCKALRRDPATARVPVFILSPTDNPTERLLALELGADEFLPSACPARELVVRVRNRLERTRQAGEPVERMHAGRLMVDLAACEASVSGEPLHLTPLEFKLLAHLMQRAGRVQTREGLLRDVWENSSAGTDRTVDTHVRRLRTKLGPAKECIRTARGTGYCFKPA